jgi:hypothetical protein
LQSRLIPTLFFNLYQEGDVFLMASKKRPKNKTSNYLISMGECLLFHCCVICLLLLTHAHTEHT